VQVDENFARPTIFEGLFTTHCFTLFARAVMVIVSVISLVVVFFTELSTTGTKWLKHRRCRSSKEGSCRKMYKIDSRLGNKACFGKM